MHIQHSKFCISTPNTIYYEGSKITVNWIFFPSLQSHTPKKYFGNFFITPFVFQHFLALLPSSNPLLT